MRQLGELARKKERLNNGFVWQSVGKTLKSNLFQDMSAASEGRAWLDSLLT